MVQLREDVRPFAIMWHVCDMKKISFFCTVKKRKQNSRWINGRQLLFGAWMMDWVCLGILPVTNLSRETGKSTNSATDLVSRLQTVWKRPVKLNGFPTALALLASQFWSVRKEVQLLFGSLSAWAVRFWTTIQSNFFSLWKFNFRFFLVKQKRTKWDYGSLAAHIVATSERKNNFLFFSFAIQYRLH